MFLDIPLVYLGRACQTGPQGVAREQGEPLGLRQIAPDPGGQHRLLDQPGDVAIRKPRRQRPGPVPGGAHEDRSEVDPGEVQPVFEGLDGAGLFGRPASDLDLAPAGLGIEGQQDPGLEDFDPSGRVRQVVLAAIQPDDLRPSEATGIARAAGSPGPAAPAARIPAWRPWPGCLPAGWPPSAPGVGRACV